VPPPNLGLSHHVGPPFCEMHMQNAASTYGDYVGFLTTYLSLVHVITPDDLVGTTDMWG